MHIFFSVGEPSGDQHAARLIDELRRRHPDLEVSGFGGPQMQAAGCRLDYQLTRLAVMGILRVLPLLWQFYKLIRQADEILARERPDAVVLVDFPGFNWWVARRAKKHGIKVFYYLPPQLWAWASWRIRRVRKYVDHVLCGLPFEQSWYAERGVEAEYVGHPFFDEIQSHQLDEAFIESYQHTGLTMGVLPGSRNHEVAQNWPLMIDCIHRLATKYRDVRFLVACYSDAHREECMNSFQAKYGTSHDEVVEFCVGYTPEIIAAADCCLMVSGSVSLELMSRGTPAVVIYYFGWVLGMVARLLVRCKYCSLPNLIIDREVMPEYFPQGDGQKTVAQVTDKLSFWIEQPEEREKVSRELTEIRHSVMRTGANERAAETILAHMQGQASRSRAA